MITFIKKQIRNLRNAIGEGKGFGGCPNCGDNWCWKTQKSGLIYDRTPGKGARGVILCDECMLGPLNEKRIAQDLLSSGWKPESVALVRIAVQKHNELIQ